MNDVPLSAIAENVAAVRERMAAACRRAGRPLAEVTLIAVSKTKPLVDIQAAVDYGMYDIGETAFKRHWPRSLMPPHSSAGTLLDIYKATRLSRP